MKEEITVIVPITEDDVGMFEDIAYEGKSVTWTFEATNGQTVNITFEPGMEEENDK